MQEFDESAELDSNLAKQRQNLKKRLGLGGPMDALVDTAGGVGCCCCCLSGVTVWPWEAYHH
jgi:hypothetical protein